MAIHSALRGIEPEVTLVLDERSLPKPADSPLEYDPEQEVARLKFENQVAYSQMHRMALDVRALRQELAQLKQVQSDADAAYYDVLFRFSRMASFRECGSLASIWRIGVFSALLAHALGESDDFCDCLQLAAPLHDVGEIALPDSLLRSTPLSASEREQMMVHCDFGYVLFSHSASRELKMAAEIALGHHERFDGQGYPGGLAGEAIPRAAAIVALVGDFERMTQASPDQAGCSIEQITEEMQRASGTCYEPLLVDAFLMYVGKFQRLRAEIDESRIRAEPADSWLRKAPERASWRRFLSFEDRR